MLLAPTDLRDIHAAFGSASALVDRRRAVYSAVLELLGGGDVPDSPDLLDSPAVRAHLGAAIVDPSLYRADNLVPLSRLAAGPAFASETARTVVMSEPAARSALDPAVRHIESELGRHGAAGGIHLVLADDPAFDGAARTVVEGLEIASKLCPELVDDLLPHVALFAIMGNGAGGQLGSASDRNYPGLIVLPRPESPIEVAEALVHEGAHQKFFDLGITRSLFGAEFRSAPTYRASWSPDTAPEWPMEQSAAAFHAYTCLATFHECIRDSGDADRLHDFTLLPKAAERAVELGEWILANDRFFGPDGRILLTALAGRRAPESEPAPAAPVVLDDGAPRVVRRFPDVTLVAQKGGSVELFWLPTASSTPGEV